MPLSRSGDPDWLDDHRVGLPCRRHPFRAIAVTDARLADDLVTRAYPCVSTLTTERARLGDDTMHVVG